MQNKFRTNFQKHYQTLNNIKNFDKTLTKHVKTLTKPKTNVQNIKIPKVSTFQKVAKRHEQQNWKNKHSNSQKQTNPTCCIAQLVFVPAVYR